MEKEVEVLATKFQGELVVSVSKEVRAKVEMNYKWAIVLRLGNEKSFNTMALVSAMGKAWNIKVGENFQEMANNRVVIKLSREEDQMRILDGGPWTFMGTAVIVEKWRKGTASLDYKESKIKIWMQVHNLPVELRDSKVPFELAEVAGRVIKDELQDKNKAASRRKFPRFRIELDISKPISRGVYILDEESKHLWIEFKYERLPNLCTRCGRLNHDTNQCPFELEGSSKFRFGSELRAENFLSLEFTSSSSLRVEEQGTTERKEMEEDGCTRMNMEGVDTSGSHLSCHMETEKGKEKRNHEDKDTFLLQTDALEASYSDVRKDKVSLQISCGCQGKDNDVRETKASYDKEQPNGADIYLSSINEENDKDFLTSQTSKIVGLPGVGLPGVGLSIQSDLVQENLEGKTRSSTEPFRIVEVGSGELSADALTQHQKRNARMERYMKRKEKMIHRIKSAHGKFKVSKVSQKDFSDGKLLKVVGGGIDTVDGDVFCSIDNSVAAVVARQPRRSQ